jgi:hypothetical protein
MENIKYTINNSMGWLQVINFVCKTCGKSFLQEKEAEACFDSHVK